MNSAFKLDNASSGSSYDVGVPSLQVPSSLPPRGSPLKIQQSLALNAAYGSSGEIKIYVEPTVRITYQKNHKICPVDLIWGRGQLPL